MPLKFMGKTVFLTSDFFKTYKKQHQTQTLNSFNSHNMFKIIKPLIIKGT